MAYQLPHASNNRNAVDKADAVFPNMFIAQLIPPTGIVAPPNLYQEIKSISGLDALTRQPEIVEQKSLGVDRLFPNPLLSEYKIELSMEININLVGDEATNLLIYQALLSWARRNRHDQTGQNFLKRDQVGQLILDRNNTRGDVWQNAQFKNVLLQELTGLDEVNIENGEPAVASVTFVAEWPKLTFASETE